MSQPALRLVRDAEIDAPLRGPRAARSTAPDPQQIAALIERQMMALQAELDAVRQEVSELHARDEALQQHLSAIDEEMRMAARLQYDFLPKNLPNNDSVAMSVIYRPASYVSGDMYDATLLDQGAGFFLSDAVGHGVPAAMLTMFIRRSMHLREHTGNGAYRDLCPSKVLGRINRALIESQLDNATFATAVAGTIDVAHDKLHLSTAGHPPPLLIGRDGSIREIEADGCLLGVFDEEPFTPTTTDFLPGERLLVYTDGIELALSDGDTIDTDRWKQRFAELAKLPSAEMLAALTAAMDNGAGSLAPKDDVTILLVERK